MTRENTAELWDGVWDRPAPIERDLYAVAKEERLIRWQRIEALILARFGGFANLSVIEVGAGRGTNSALMARRGARVTVLDYSESALERSRRLFDGLELPVELVLQDALDLPESLRGKYDVSMSFGLAEHFLGDSRRAVLQAHFDLLKDGGLAFISVPNAHNPPYRLYKWITEKTGRWSIGEEYPFSRPELERYCGVLGVEEYGFFGDSLWRSKKFLNPIKWVPRRKKKPARRTASAPAGGHEASPHAQREPAKDAPSKGEPSKGEPSKGKRARSKRRYRRLPRRERGTRWDARFSYALVLWASKPKSGAATRAREP